MLHVGLAPTPDTVEDILLAKLYGNHQTIRHSLGTHIVVLDIGDVTHVVAYLEIDLVGTTEHIVEHFLQLRVDIGLLVSHLHEQVTILSRLKAALCPWGQSQGIHSQHQ